MALETEFDILILGGGSGGYAVALRGAQLGFKIGIIEKNKIGGTCLHHGCIPTKTLLHAAEIVDNIRESEKFGIKANLESININDINKYKNDTIDKLYKGLKGLLSNKQITTIYGEGKLISNNSIEVNGISYTGSNIVLATGSYPKIPSGIKISKRIISSEQALSMNNLPKKAIILGGGVIGVEFASAWKSLGVDITVIEGGPNLVINEDRSISKFLEKQFNNRNINLFINTFVQEINESKASISVKMGNGKIVDADLMLVAVGRGPSSSGFGYEEVGIKIINGFIDTNNRLLTSVDNIYAVGDIVSGPQLAHRGFQHGIFVAEEIAGMNPIEICDTLIPKVVYCDPEIASIGLNEQQAKDKYKDIDCVEYNLIGNGKSNILKKPGFIKVISKKNGPIIGVHMIGARISEQIGEAQMIVNWEALPSDVAHFIHAHPTQNEAIGEAFLKLSGKPLHMHN